MNLLVGANGQGKTNVLESLALVSGRPSFRTADLADVVRAGEAAAAVSVHLTGEPDGALGALLSRGRREHAWNGKKVSRLEASRKLPIVFLTSADLGRLGGPPAERRRALDRVAVALEPGLAGEFRRYEKARAERVALLAAPGRPDRDALSSWEEILAATGAAIASARRRRIGPLGRRLADTARLLGSPWSDVSLRLVSDLPAEARPRDARRSASPGTETERAERPARGPGPLRPAPGRRERRLGTDGPFDEGVLGRDPDPRPGLGPGGEGDPRRGQRSASRFSPSTISIPSGTRRS